MNNAPAILACDSRTASLEIAGLTALDRLVVTAHRAGCAPIFVACENAPALVRAEALGIQTSQGSDVTRAALRVEGGVIAEVSDLENVIAQRGQLISREGRPLPVRMNVDNPPPVAAGPVAMSIVDEVSAAEAERRLWASLTSTADGLVDRFFNRPLGRPISQLLIRTPISPNQVSIASILIGVASAWFFARGYFVTGALVFQLCAIVDCVDGDLARALFKQSHLGKWLDLGGDQVVHFSVFAAIGIGIARSNATVPALALGTSAAVGVVLCFVVIVRALRMSAPQRGPHLNRLLDATANRDFSVLLLAVALWGRMDLFLWMAGIGIHVFWMMLLALQVGRPTVAIARESP